MYRCDLSEDGCENCSGRNECSKVDAIKYRKFKNKRSKEINKNFFCSETKGLCKKVCPKYGNCGNKAKKDFIEWKNAYRTQNEELLNKFCRRDGMY